MGKPKRPYDWQRDKKARKDLSKPVHNNPVTSKGVKVLPKDK